MSEISHEWLAFLARHGAQAVDPESSAVGGFGSDLAIDQPATDFVAPLTDLGLIAANGEAAAAFLHTQLTNDVEHLGAGEARLAGYCSPKGRLLASFLMWKSADTIYLQLPRQIQPAVQKRLQMFILRAKATLTDVSEHHVALGLAGASAQDILGQWFSSLPARAYDKVDTDQGTLIRVPDAEDVARYQWIAPVAIACNAWPQLTRSLRPVGTGIWRLTDIRAGIPQITLPIQEKFVPQMVNFEAIGGVSFKKGCYPGQEIVARSQYLGKLKRRTALATVADPAARAGMEVFASSDPDQPCGMVVNAEPRGDGIGADCLVEIKTAMREQGSVHLSSAQGPALQFRPLPYALPDPE